MDNAAAILHQNSGATAYNTPADIVEIGRCLVGGAFDLDPASNEFANSYIRAKTYYTEEMNGFCRPWGGRLWMNHPFANKERACGPNCKKKICEKRGYCTPVDIPGNADWIDKLVQSWEDGDVTAACCICFAATSENWFAPLLRFPQFYFTGRVNYILPDGTETDGVLKGSALTYLPPKSMPFELAGTLMKHLFANTERKGMVKIAI